MRNLKRALSLALASVMLLGMMVVGSSAAFTDADEIVNTKAVEITAGLGLFAGMEDGSFDPKGTVTRAQMATVIAKMLHGADVDADNYKGTNKFNDVSGWAEGFINLCAAEGVVAGYGDGSFRPEEKLTTGAAVTMLLNALGAKPATDNDWPLNYMAKAEEIDLFEDMKGAKPGTNNPMSRDQLAVAVWNGLNYSEDGVLGWKIDGVDTEFKTLADAVAYADAKGIDLTATEVYEVKGDTLAKEVFELKHKTGYITANQATGEKSTHINGNLISGEDYNIETGLDQLGHYVTVYFAKPYDNEKKPGKAYAVVEMAEYVTVEKTITKKADYIDAFGAKVEAVVDIDTYNENAYTAPAGTYVISTDEDNNEGKIISFIAPVGATADVVTAVSDVAGKEYIKIGNKRYDNNADKDVIVAYDGIAEDDVVVYKQYADSEGNTMTYVFKPEVVSGKITQTKVASGDYAFRVWVDGTEYEKSGITLATDSLVACDTINLANDADNTYDVYLYNGKVFGLKETAGSANIGEVIYVINKYTKTVEGSYGDDGAKAHYYVQGVNAQGEEVTILVGIEDCAKNAVKYPVIDDFGTGTWDHDDDAETEEVVKYPVNAFYTFKKSADADQAKKDIMLPTLVTDVADFDPDEDDYFAAVIAQVEAEGTLGTDLEKNSKYVKVTGGDRVYLTADTKYFVVDNSKGLADVKVSVYTGGIKKDIEDAIDANKVAVIATEDENENRYAELIVINAASGLAAEDYIYVADIATADASSVKGGYKVNAFFSETNEFKTIVVASEVPNGFYTDWEIDEDGIYTLADFEGDPSVFGEQLLTGFVGDAIITKVWDDEAEDFVDALDLADTTGVKIYDMRDPEIIEDSEVAEIATVKDLQIALKADKNVYFDALVDVDGDENVVTHIFVYSVQYELLDCAENTIDWVEDDGTVYSKEQLCAKVDDNHDKTCDECGHEWEVIEA